MGECPRVTRRLQHVNTFRTLEGRERAVVRDKEAAMSAQRAIDALTGSVRDLANTLGVSEATVGSWRLKRRSPSKENLLKLANAADRRADELRGVAVELRRIASGNDSS